MRLALVPIGISIVVLAARLAGLEAAPVGVAAQPISEIVLERGPCYGTCPVYRVTLRSDGTARYVGWNHAARIGVYRGTISPAEFRRLASAVEAAGFGDLRDSYLQPVTDLPVVRTSVVREASDRKVVRDHGAVGVTGLEGPAELLDLHAAIDRAADGITWSPVPESPGVLLPGSM